MTRLLLVEDDPQLGDGLAVGLRQAGHAVDWVTDGVAAGLALANGDYDLLLLDLGLPGQSGLSVLRGLRGRRDAIPVLILTARDATADKVAGLDAGADDYLVKPVALDELAARIRALCRRAAGRAEPVLRVGTLALDLARHVVEDDGQALDLSVREFALLEVLAENAGRVMTRAQLESAVYGWDEAPDSNAIEVHIHHLRRKIGPQRIRTLRGVGYQLAKP